MRAAGRSQLVVGMILAWSVIYLIHVFAFPVYEGNAARATSGGSLASLEGALCGRHRSPPPPGSRAARARLPKCPQAGIVTAWPGGRTGNLISEYASLWAFSRRTGLEPYAPPCLLAPIANTFANLTVPSMARVRHCRARWSTLVHEPRAWNRSSQALVLPAHTLLVEELLPQLEALRRELDISPALRARARAVLHDLTPVNWDIRPVYVGVHVRRSDYARYLRRTLNAAPAPVQFYREAIMKFERRFPSALFVVLSDDPRWCQENLKGSRVKVVSQPRDEEELEWESDDETEWERARLDLAVLASCNHTIFDYGTFGLWGALLSGGDAIVYHVSASHAAVRVARALKGWSLLPRNPPPTLVPLRRFSHKSTTDNR